jgi:pimeloyl-ACP methyl ester carboxylesterase
VRVPTLIVHGEYDRIIPASEARFLNNHIPQSRLVIFPEAGHLLLAEAPKKLYETAELFFSAVEGRS